MPKAPVPPRARLLPPGDRSSPVRRLRDRQPARPCPGRARVRGRVARFRVSCVAKPARRPRGRVLLEHCADVGGPAWLVLACYRRDWAAQMFCRSCDGARRWSGCVSLARRARPARPRLGRAASCLADERARRKRARSVADAAPNVRRSAGPSDAIVSSTGMPAMCASGVTGRSPWCSRLLGGAPRGRGRGRRGGCGSRRRSRCRPASRRRASS